MRIAVVGCGAVAEMGHIPAACKIGNVELAGLVDADLKRAEELADRFRVPRVAQNLAELEKEVDAVIVSTPPHIRPTIAEQAFSAGLHVLCEKPLANTSAECVAILAAAKRSGRRLAVAHTARFFPNRLHVLTLLQRNSLGRLRTVDVEQGDPYDWPTRSGYTVRPELVAGGVLLNEGLHTVDSLLWWFGAPISFDYQDDALGGIESNVRIKMMFSGNLSCSFRLSRTCKLDNRITIHGDSATLSLPLYGQAEIEMIRSKRREIQRVATADWNFVELVSEQLKDFIQGIQTQQPPRGTGEDGLTVIRFIENCYRAKRQRARPKFAPSPGLTW